MNPSPFFFLVKQREIQMETVEELKEKLAEVHHASKEAKELKAKIKELEGGEGEVSAEEPKPEVKKEKPKKEETVVKNPYSPLDFEIDPNRTYEFHLRKKRIGRKNVPRTALVWDEEEGRIREIRYTKTEATPYKEDQDENAIPATIAPVFRDGKLKVQGSNEPLIRFMLAYDGFDKKTRIHDRNKHEKALYTLYEPEKEQKALRTRGEVISKATKAVEEADVEKLKNFLSSRFGKKGLTEDGVIGESYDLARKYPLDFIRDLNNPIHKIKAELSTLLDSGVLSERSGTVVWTESGSKAFTFDPTKGKPVLDVLSKWVLAGSPQAKEFKEVMYSKLEED